MIAGIGIDIVEIDRIKRSEERWGPRFLNRVFTEGELNYCFNRKSTHTHLAARFASKEAVMKAFGTGLSSGVAWKDIEMVNRAGGKPEILLHGRLREMAVDIAVKEIHISVTHDNGCAIAQVILERD